MKRTRTFNGNTYQLSGTRSARWTAEQVAQRVRHQGKAVRVTPIGPGGIVSPEGEKVEYGFAIWIKDDGSTQT